jgi:hypothetical protein
MMSQETAYLIIHGTLTVDSVIAILIRTEHRLTKLETKLEDHERYTGCQPAKEQKPKL